MILTFVVLTSTIVHELFHQYDFREIDQICAFGYEKDDNIFNAAFGWNQAKTYWHRDELTPTIAGFVWMFVSFTTLIIIFLRDDEV